MEASLEPRWRQQFGLRGLLALFVVLFVATYAFDPPIQQPGIFIGQVRRVELNEQPKTGFRQSALVKLTTGEWVHAKVSADLNDEVSDGDVVTLVKYKSLRSNKLKFLIVPNTNQNAPN